MPAERMLKIALMRICLAMRLGSVRRHLRARPGWEGFEPRSDKLLINPFVNRPLGRTAPPHRKRQRSLPASRKPQARHGGAARRAL